MPTRPTLAATPDAPFSPVLAAVLPVGAADECDDDDEGLLAPEAGGAPPAEVVGAAPPGADVGGAAPPGAAPPAEVGAAPPTGADDAASIWAWTVELKVPVMPESLLINRVSWRPDGTRARRSKKHT